MKRINRLGASFLAASIFLISLSSIGDLVHGQAQRFGDALESSIALPSSMQQNLPQTLQQFAGAFDDIEYGIGPRNFIMFLWLQVAVPLLIFAGIVIAIVGFYKLMTANTEEQQQKGKDFLLWWVVGTLIVTSAAYLTNLLLGTTWSGGIFGSLWQTQAPISGVELAQSLYDQVFFPAVMWLIFLAMGILFVMVLIHSFRYLFGNNEDIQKKSFNMIIYNAMGIGVILLAKTIVELVYGSYGDVIDSGAEFQNLGLIGSGVLDSTDLGIFYTILNWIMWLATLIIIIILIYQGYLLLVNPNNEETVKKIKKNFLYIFIGLLVLGASYLIVNVFIIN